jgi:8-oxo-dGTP diphosphatase
MKKVEVVAALITQNETVLIAQRKTGEFSGMWEFPGGKIELGESHSDALKREILEELNLPISVDDYLTTVEYDYPTFHLNFENLEHSDIKFVSFRDLPNQYWLPADVQVASEIVKRKGN